MNHVEQDDRWSLARSLLKENKPCFRATIDSLLEGYKPDPPSDTPAVPTACRADEMSLVEFADACYDATSPLIEAYRHRAAAAAALPVKSIRRRSIEEIANDPEFWRQHFGEAYLFPGERR